MNNNIRKNCSYLLNGQAEPNGGLNSLALAALTLGLVAIIAVGGLIA